MRENDAWKKLKGKDYYDRKNRVKENNLGVGDKVLVRAEKKNKLSTEFNPESFEIMERKGNTVTVKSKEGKIYKRNLTQVKKFIDSSSEEEVESDGEENEQSTQRKKGNVEVSAEEGNKINRKVPERGNIEANGEEGKPKRNRKVPERFGDYKMYQIVK